MDIIKTFYNLKCVECEQEILYFDLIHMEFYCRSCGLIHNSEMIEQAKDNYLKARIKEIKQQLKKENKQQYNNFVNDLKAIERTEKEKELKKLHMTNKSQMKLNEINYLLYGSNTRKQGKQKIKN